MLLAVAARGLATLLLMVSARLERVVRDGKAFFILVVAKAPVGRPPTGS